MNKYVRTRANQCLYWFTRWVDPAVHITEITLICIAFRLLADVILRRLSSDHWERERENQAGFLSGTASLTTSWNAEASFISLRPLFCWSESDVRLSQPCSSATLPVTKVCYSCSFPFPTIVYGRSKRSPCSRRFFLRMSLVIVTISLVLINSL